MTWTVQESETPEGLIEYGIANANGIEFSVSSPKRLSKD